MRIRARELLVSLAGFLMASQALSATRCQINFSTCPNYPSLSNAHVDDAVNGAAQNASACTARASDYYWWCNASGAAGVVTATFFDNNSPIDSKRAGQPNSCPVGWICPWTQIYNSKIGMWYSVWWQSPGSPNGGHHWNDSRYRPELGYYDSETASVVQTHFTQMKSAGVDYIIFDDTNIWNNDDGGIDQNVRSVMSQVGAMPAGSRIPYSFAIGGMLWAWHSETGQTEEADRVYTFATSSNFGPSYFQWQGKPLLVNYNAFDVGGTFLPNWSDSRFSTRNATGIVKVDNPNLWPYGNLGWWGWAQMYPQPASAEAVGVTPGADNAHRGCPGCNIAVNRENGRVFMLEWLRAIACRPATIVVSSWNEFGDETSIEPAFAVGNAPRWVDAYGVETPDLYLQIASAYAALRAGLRDGEYYQDLDGMSVYKVQSGRLVYQSAMPHGKPVILLPAGTIRGLLGRVWISS